MAEQNQPQTQPQTAPKKKIMPDFTSPEAIMMMFFAVTVDLVGYVLLIAALDDFWMTDIAGMLIIGSWIFIRGSGISEFKGGKGGSSKMKSLKRFGIATATEAIPYVGSFSPSWTIAVWKELKR